MYNKLFVLTKWFYEFAGYFDLESIWRHAKLFVQPCFYIVIMELVY